MNGFEEKYYSRKEFEMLVKKYDKLCLEESGDFRNYFELIFQKYNIVSYLQWEIEKDIENLLETKHSLKQKLRDIIEGNRGEEIFEIEIIQVGEYIDYEKNAYKFYFLEWHTILTDGKLTDDYKLNDEQEECVYSLLPKLNHIERYIGGFININEALNVKDDLIANNKFLINYLNEVSKKKD